MSKRRALLENRLAAGRAFRKRVRNRRRKR